METYTVPSILETSSTEYIIKINANIFYAN